MCMLGLHKFSVKIFDVRCKKHFNQTQRICYEYRGSHILRRSKVTCWPGGICEKEMLVVMVLPKMYQNNGISIVK